MSASPRLSARHLEPYGRPNGGVWRASPTEGVVARREVNVYFSTARPSSTGESWFCTSLFGEWSPDPTVLCERRSPSPRPSARHLETHGQPNGGVRRLCTSQRNKSDRRENTRQPQLCSMPV